MARTTAVELKGDRYKAEQLSLAHTQRLLRTFRENSAFQSLQQNKHEENFFDETGAYIGKISMQTVFGVEKVIVDVRSGRPRPQKEAWKTDSRLVSQIVPCIRSVDNLWWVACLSGTFDGPYYAFKNIYEISAEEMDDNVEVELDKKLISIGTAPLGGGDLPKLFFIAQTGARPEGEEYELVPDSSFSRDMSHTGNSIQICGEIAKTDTSGTGHEFATASEKINVFGQTLNIPESNTSTTVTRTRTWITCSTGVDKIYEVCGESLAEETLPSITEFFARPQISYSDGDRFHLSSTTIDCFPWGGNESVRSERANTENFAACYRCATRNIENLGARGYEPCAYTAPDYVYDIIDTDTETFCDYFKVDAVDYPLRGESESIYPRFSQRGLKYYNTDSPAAITAITAARADYLLDGVTYSWPYYYVGPNSDYDLARTLFIPDSGVYGGDGHIIPNVIGLDDDTVMFEGEIFLGMIQYTVTEKKQVYS